MGQWHYHVDVFKIKNGVAYFERDSKPLIGKSVAWRAFEAEVEEARKQVGKLTITKCSNDEFPGAIRIARNHRIAIVLSRCDCDSGREVTADEKKGS